MPRRSSRRSTRISQEDERDDDEHEPSPPSQRRRTVLSQQRRQQSQSQSQDFDDIDDDDDAMQFSSQAPELSQDILPVRETERRNLDDLNEATKDKAILDLTRLILFKGLAGEAIDRVKCFKQLEIHDKRVSTAVFHEANERLRNVFDFELRRMPVWMEQIKGFPKTFKDRYYLVNSGTGDNSGQFCKVLHAVHDDAVIERGFLMIVLALCYCQGEPRHDGSRWIAQHDLYTLLHRVDEHIPSEAPSSNKRRSSQATMSSQRLSQVGADGGGVGMTPDVDFLLHKMVQRDYLVTQKVAPETGAADETVVYYTMGPRAAMEIGRRQVIYFCAEILDQDPDPTMLLELENGEEGGTASQQELM